ncbi:hypothetical protein GCM10022403_099000 [Streptomyces coacervatus]|uniref:Uncharacterized protein n=1 Tax=Streptomyces coacervatus TaxID=647381 RepID=A0ABP7JSW6_9ACTN|nr:hypothetical protein [Streptomyces coacervatus]MDF2263863.1 hypothetical protein [Streptomyces coacervatus]
MLILERTPLVNAARAAGVTSLVCGSGPSPRPLLPEWRWLGWTLTEHIEHLDADPGPQAEPVQEGLFTA